VFRNTTQRRILHKKSNTTSNHSKGRSLSVANDLLIEAINNTLKSSPNIPSKYTINQTNSSTTGNTTNIAATLNYYFLPINTIE